MSKKIGIPGWVIDGRVFGVSLPYAEFIRRFGELIILSPDGPVREDLDLLILPGGADVAPHKHSNSKLSLYTGSSNAMLEYFDSKVLPEYINMKQSILSICRGSQLLWSYFGGKIIQHYYSHTQSEYPTDQCHQLVYTPEYTKFSSKLSEVNSRHHQTMCGEEIPEELEVIAYAAETVGNTRYLMKDIVEIFKHKELPIYAYQSHPEDMRDDSLTESFIMELFERNKQ